MSRCGIRWSCCGIAITAAVYFGLTTAEKAEAWWTSHLSTMHLIAGVIIMLLGVGMSASGQIRHFRF
jgi:uncharacterized ion transporter superfamily protein YfcC